jgi:H+/Cl- antiporter ClcA
MKQHKFQIRMRFNRFFSRTSIAALFVTISSNLKAQTADGNNGLTQATTLVKSYFPNAILLMYAIGAVVGIVGAVKVYNAWSHGDQQTNKLAASWFGACIFLVVVATVLKNFFGIPG